MPALLVAAIGRIDLPELPALDELDACDRIGVSSERFIELAQRCVDDIGHRLCEQSWLRLVDRLALMRWRIAQATAMSAMRHDAVC